MIYAYISFLTAILVYTFVALARAYIRKVDEIKRLHDDIKSSLIKAHERSCNLALQTRVHEDRLHEINESMLATARAIKLVNQDQSQLLNHVNVIFADALQLMKCEPKSNKGA